MRRSECRPVRSDGVRVQVWQRGQQQCTAATVERGREEEETSWQTNRPRSRKKTGWRSTVQGEGITKHTWESQYRTQGHTKRWNTYTTDRVHS